MATRDCAAATAASATARLWVAVSIWVTVVTPRSMSVCVRSNWRRAKASSSSARRISERAHVEGGARLGHACLGLRPAARVQKRGAERLDTRDQRSLLATTGSPTETGARRAVPAMGLATS